MKPLQIVYGTVEEAEAAIRSHPVDVIKEIKSRGVYQDGINDIYIKILENISNYNCKNALSLFIWNIISIYLRAKYRKEKMARYNLETYAQLSGRSYVTAGDFTDTNTSIDIPRIKSSLTQKERLVFDNVILGRASSQDMLKNYGMYKPEILRHISEIRDKCRELEFTF